MMLYTFCFGFVLAHTWNSFHDVVLCVYVNKSISYYVMTASLVRTSEYMIYIIHKKVIFSEWFLNAILLLSFILLFLSFFPLILSLWVRCERAWGGKVNVNANTNFEKYKQPSCLKIHTIHTYNNEHFCCCSCYSFRASFRAMNEWMDGWMDVKENANLCN
jgi:hypothetical protein